MLAIGLTSVAISIGIVVGILLKNYNITEYSVTIACVITGALTYIFLGGDIK